MTKRISITIPDYIYEKCLSEYKGNKSQYISGLLNKGFEIENDTTDSLRNRNIKLRQEVYNKNEEINKLKIEIGRLKKQIKPEESPEEIRARQFAKGWRKAGMNRKIAEKMPL
jgi:peptidoglycan hydrolase CwlO-like protein